MRITGCYRLAAELARGEGGEWDQTPQPVRVRLRELCCGDTFCCCVSRRMGTVLAFYGRSERVHSRPDPISTVTVFWGDSESRVHPDLWVWVDPSQIGCEDQLPPLYLGGHCGRTEDQWLTYSGAEVA